MRDKEHKVQIYPSIGRAPDISAFHCKEVYVDGEYIGTYQPEIWHSEREGTKVLKDDIGDCLNKDFSRRQKYNKKIINLLSEYVNKNPDLRFIQILWGLGIINRDSTGTIIDKFHEESEDTFKQLEEKLNAETSNN